ncbi:hypothetical protein V8E55_004116 [Tylopilus felleus]
MRGERKCAPMYDIIPEDELCNPQHLDVHNQKCLLVVKNGMTTATTFGRINGLESFIRHNPPYGINETSTEIAMLRYSKDHARFSEPVVEVRQVPRHPPLPRRQLCV